MAPQNRKHYTAFFHALHAVGALVQAPVNGETANDAQPRRLSGDGYMLGVYSDSACRSLVKSIHVESDFCHKSQMQCMGPLAMSKADGSVQDHISIRYRIHVISANESRFDLECFVHPDCHGDLNENYNTGSMSETKKLFTFQCARASRYPAFDSVYLKWAALPQDCFAFHGDIMLVTTTTTTTTTTKLSPGACGYEDAFLHPFRMVAGQLGTHGNGGIEKPSIGAVLNYPTDIVLDPKRQSKPSPPVRTFSTVLPVHGAVVMRPLPQRTPYGRQVLSYGAVVMPSATLALPPELREEPDGAAVMPEGGLKDPEPFVMTPGVVRRLGAQTVPYAAAVMPPGHPGPPGTSFGAVVLPAGVPATPAGAQILSFGADVVAPGEVPEMPRWAQVTPPQAAYGPPGFAAEQTAAIDAGVIANLILPGTKPLPLADIVPPGEPIVVPQPFEPRDTPAGAQQAFIADSANHAVRLANFTTGIMSTVAGIVGKAGSSGDGGPATSAYLLYPRGLALDVASRRLYVADYGNHAVRMVDLATGIIETVAGVLGSSGATEYEGSASSVRLRFPMGLALDAEGARLYIADSGNHVIRLLDLRQRSISTIAGTLGVRGKRGDGGHAKAAQVNTPTHLALHEAAASLYIADHYNHAVRVLDLATGSLSTLAGILGAQGTSGDGAPDGLAIQSALNHPTGMSLDSTGKVLYIADASNFAIRQLDLTSGILSQTTMYTFSSRPGFLGKSGDGGPLGLAFDDITKELYVAEAYNDAVQAVDSLAELKHHHASCRAERVRAS